MKYVLRYCAALVLPPTPHEVLELVLAGQSQTGDECESVELTPDNRCQPGYLYLIPKEEDDREAWQG